MVWQAHVKSVEEKIARGQMSSCQLARGQTDAHTYITHKINARLVYMYW